MVAVALEAVRRREHEGERSSRLVGVLPGGRVPKQADRAGIGHHRDGGHGDLQRVGNVAIAVGVVGEYVEGAR